MCKMPNADLVPGKSICNDLESLDSVGTLLYTGVNYRERSLNYERVCRSKSQFFTEEISVSR